MKILFFSPYFTPYTSGITTYPQILFSHLSKNHEIKVLTFLHEKNLKKIENLNNLEVQRMDFLFRVSKGFISIQSLYYFYKEIKKADVVFLNIPNVEGLPIALISKFIIKKPIVAIYHCHVFLGKSFFEKIVNSIISFSVDCQLSNSNIITGYTEEYLEMMKIKEKYKNSKVIITLPPIPYFESDEKWINKEKNIKKETIYIGFSGRIAREKGVQYLIEAVRQLKNENFDIKIVFAGPFGKDVSGENEYYNEIITLLNENNIKYNFFGILKKAELSSFYELIDILVLPSINSTEAFGMVQAESMTHGTPVITTDLPGVSFAVKKTNMGIIVKQRNSEELAKAIKEIILNKNKYTNKEKIEFAKSLFDINKTFKTYDEILSELHTP